MIIQRFDAKLQILMALLIKERARLMRITVSDKKRVSAAKLREN